MTYGHAPNLYGVRCLDLNPSWHQSINVSFCASSINSFCSAINEGRVAASSKIGRVGYACFFFLSFLHILSPAGIDEK